MEIINSNSKSDRSQVMERKNLSWNDIEVKAIQIAREINQLPSDSTVPPLKIYGIPRGGIFAAQTVFPFVKKKASLVEKPSDDCIFIDDIIGTGETREKFISEYEYPGLTFYALVDKTIEKDLVGTWISFPWERMTNEDSPTDNIRRLIEYIGDDLEREGLKETPERVIRSYEKLFGGYKQNPTHNIKVFENKGCDEMVVVKNIEFYSTCEHHMLPFYGKAHIAYIPDKKIVGISKLARILEIYSRRLQIQERLCQQVTETIDVMVKPKGSACVLEACHLCMMSRGVEKQSSILVTSSLTGVFKESIKTRSEFIAMLRR